MSRYLLTVLFFASFCLSVFAAEENNLPEIKKRPNIHNNLDPVVFVTPGNWKDSGKVNPAYDYSFMSGKRSDPSFFEVYLRSLNVPDQDAYKWSQDERRAHLGKKALRVSEPQQLDISRRKWFWIESTWIAGNASEPKPKVLVVEQYFSKDKSSNTIVEVAVLCQQEKIREDLRGEVASFLKSISCGKDTRQKPVKEISGKGKSGK